MKFIIETHSQIDKCFYFRNGHVCMDVDYDDVNHMEVDAAVKHKKQIREKTWDENEYKRLYKDELVNRWNLNEGDIQSDYKDEGGFAGYLKARGGLDY